MSCAAVSLGEVPRIGVGCSLGEGTASPRGARAPAVSDPGEALTSAGVGVLAGWVFFSLPAVFSFVVFFFELGFFFADFDFAVAAGVGLEDGFGRGVACSSSSLDGDGVFFFLAAEPPGLGVGVFVGFAFVFGGGVLLGLAADFFLGDAVGDGDSLCVFEAGFGGGVSSSSAT